MLSVWNSLPLLVQLFRLTQRQLACSAEHLPELVLSVYSTININCTMCSVLIQGFAAEGPYLWKSHLHTCQGFGTQLPSDPQPSPTAQPGFAYLSLLTTCRDRLLTISSSRTSSECSIFWWAYLAFWKLVIPQSEGESYSSLTTPSLGILDYIARLLIVQITLLIAQLPEPIRGLHWPIHNDQIVSTAW